MRLLLKHGLLFLSYGAICSIAVLVFIYIHQLQTRPELRVWHTAELQEEFTVDYASTINTFAVYQQLEQRLFRQLLSKVYDQVQGEDRRQLNRYSKGSLADPEKFDRNWNRSFEFSTPDPKGGVLLIHGLSDSPYSMRSLAKLFQSLGFWVVGLRLPGHGAAPSGLVTSTWQDFIAAG